jgi:hypothetical protein
MMIYVYPNSSEEMSTTEKAYSLLVNNSALDLTNMNQKVKLQSFSDLTGTTSLVGILIARHIDYSLSLIQHAQSFIVRSYHASNGLIIPGCEQSDGTLKLFKNQTTGNRRPPDIQYDKFACNVIFNDLTLGNTQPYPFTYYVRLPVETHTVQNSTGADVQQTSFFRQCDWAMLNDQAVLDDIWYHPRSLKKPFFLIPPKIQDPNADAEIKIKE